MTPDYLVTQIFNGLVNGGFYALLALGLSIIFGMLRIVNFAHGATYMLGAFVAYYGALYVHLPFFAALVVGPVVVALFGLLLETLLLRRLYNVDPLYNLLFTFAVVLMLEDGMRLAAGALGSPYETPAILAGSVNPRVRRVSGLPALHHRGLRDRVSRDVSRDRAKPARRAHPRRDRETRTHARVRHQYTGNS